MNAGGVDPMSTTDGWVSIFAFFLGQQAPGLWDWPPFAASILMGLAVLALVLWLLHVLKTEELPQEAEWRYDISRINQLRKQDVVYRLFQTPIQLLARFNRGAFPGLMPTIKRDINAAGLSGFWLPEEYLARMQMLSFLGAPVYVYFGVGMLGVVEGILSAVVIFIVLVWLLRRRLAAKATMRIRQIKRRMPYLLDLLTLLIEAGATFLGALSQAVKEFRGHPIAEEFGRVLADMNLGKTRTEAFQAMRERLQDDELSSIVGSIIQGEELGTPMANVFRTQADVLRIKRTQRAETIAAEAGVNMLLPAVLVMMAAVLIIVAPFLMNYWNFGLLL